VQNRWRGGRSGGGADPVGDEVGLHLRADAVVERPHLRPERGLGGLVGLGVLAAVFGAAVGLGIGVRTGAPVGALAGGLIGAAVGASSGSGVGSAARRTDERASDQVPKR
jgi:hypothetical protein